MHGKRNNVTRGTSMFFHIYFLLLNLLVAFPLLSAVPLLYLSFSRLFFRGPTLCPSLLIIRHKPAFSRAWILWAILPSPSLHFKQISTRGLGLQTLLCVYSQTRLALSWTHSINVACLSPIVLPAPTFFVLILCGVYRLTPFTTTKKGLVVLLYAKRHLWMLMWIFSQLLDGSLTFA